MFIADSEKIVNLTKTECTVNFYDRYVDTYTKHVLGGEGILPKTTTETSFGLFTLQNFSSPPYVKCNPEEVVQLWVKKEKGKIIVQKLATPSCDKNNLCEENDGGMCSETTPEAYCNGQNQCIYNIWYAGKATADPNKCENNEACYCYDSFSMPSGYTCGEGGTCTNEGYEFCANNISDMISKHYCNCNNNDNGLYVFSAIELVLYFRSIS